MRRPGNPVGKRSRAALRRSRTPEATGSSPIPPIPVSTRTFLVLGALVVTSAAASAQALEDRTAALARFRAAAESTAHESWSRTGAIIGGTGGALAFAAAFYKFSHRDGAVNHTEGTLGGTLVGAAGGAVGGALLGSFIGSLIPKHSK